MFLKCLKAYKSYYLLHIFVNVLWCLFYLAAITRNILWRFGAGFLSLEKSFFTVHSSADIHSARLQHGELTPFFRLGPRTCGFCINPSPPATLEQLITVAARHLSVQLPSRSSQAPCFDNFLGIPIPWNPPSVLVGV